MANECNNVLTLTGSTEELNRFRELFKGNQYRFSYQPLIPMPEELDIPPHHYKFGRQAVVMYLYQNTVRGKCLASELDVERYKKYDPDNVYELMDETGAWAADVHEKVAALYEQSGPYPGRCPDGKDYEEGVCPAYNGCPVYDEDYYMLGKRIISNAANYGGCCDWFEFRMDKWGVMNDAATEDLVEVKDGSITIRFDSDNRPPRPVFLKILAMFPTLNLVDSVECERAGFWTITSEAGKLVESNFRGPWDET